jgi:hypothetical protein
MYTLQGKTRPTRHVRFPHQSTYAQRTRPVGGLHTWQLFMSHRQSWVGPLLPRKRTPGTIHNTPADRSTSPYPASLMSRGYVDRPMKQWGAKPSIYQRQATMFTGPISPACDRYVQYFLTGTNHSVLNWHRRGLPHRKPQNSHNTLSALLFWVFH